MNDQYNILLQKLDRFIRRYYKNQLIKGFIYCSGLLIIFYLTVNFIEYLGNFNTTTRTWLFWSYIVLNVVIVSVYLVYPILKLYRIGSIITYDEAARIIGKHFQSVNDKLLNVLQLKELSLLDQSSFHLIEASIEQKIKGLKPIPFNNAIDLKRNRKYLKIAIIPLITLGLVFISSPKVITEPTYRLVNYNSHFERPMPFKIDILNNKFEVIQHDDFLVQLHVKGEEVPGSIFIQFENSNSKFTKLNNNRFEYLFNRVQKDIRFVIVADRYRSPEYTLYVLPKPIILDFEVNLDYPGYTRKKDETLYNTGDLVVPQGSQISWKFKAQNTRSISFDLAEDHILLESTDEGIFRFNRRFYQSSDYVIKSSNQFLINQDSLAYAITVVPDSYPIIDLREFRDPDFNNKIFFNGSIKDDYGFNALVFNYSIIPEGTQVPDQQLSDSLQINRYTNPQDFYYILDLSALGLNPGYEAIYYFEVWDNDEINGSKSVKSQVMQYKVPSLRELDQELKNSNLEFKSELEATIDESRDLQNEIIEIQKKLVDKEQLTWEDTEQIKELLSRQSSIENKLKELFERNQENFRQELQYKEIDDQIIEKQNKLEELFEKLMNDEEIRKLFEDLQKIVDEFDKDKMKKMLDDMKLSNEDLEKMLDRNLELYKQLEFERKLDETIKKLDQLAKEQLEQSEKTTDKNKDFESLTREQSGIQEEFHRIAYELEELDQLNRELEEPNEFDKQENEEKQVEDALNESLQQLEKKQRKNASGAQKNASQKMQQMAESLFQMQQSMIQQSMSEDIDAMRDILENLIQLSFDQEELIEKVGKTNVNDPSYTKIVQSQSNMRDLLTMVSDSLYALSKRQIMIEPFVSKEVQLIDQHIERSINYLNNRQSGQAAASQQYIMTSLNNLALMLSETLQRMVQSMMMQSQNSSSCKNSGMPKPGQGKVSLQSLRQMQQQLNEQIEKMKLGKQQEGKDNPGGKQSTIGQTMSEQLARTAAQQEYIRNEIRKLSEQLEKEGSFGNSKELKKLMNEMEKTETDLVNKMITQETLLRQKQILTKLLESEKAQLERDREQKRESVEAKKFENRNSADFDEYKRLQKNEVELIKTVTPALKPFYKAKVDQYIFNFAESLEK